MYIYIVVNIEVVGYQYNQILEKYGITNNVIFFNLYLFLKKLIYIKSNIIK